MSRHIKPKRITAPALNKANALFWDYENLRDKAEHDELSDEERVIMLGYAAIGERMKRLAARKGAMNSADIRRDSVAARNQAWRDAHANGKTPKQIYLDQPKGRGKKKVSLSTINRALKGLRRP
jgi:hypothetical protein